MEKFEDINLGNGITLLKNTGGKYKVLFAHLFHGNENCIDVILNYMIHGYKDISISFIPMVNSEGTRNNKDGKNINCSFNHPDCKHTNTTTESEIILSNIELIKECSRDGYASLHSHDGKMNYSHIWMQNEPSEEILKTMRVKDYNLCYNTLEDYLWHEGIPIGACLEYGQDEERIEFTNNFLEIIRNESNVLC